MLAFQPSNNKMIIDKYNILNPNNQITLTLKFCIFSQKLKNIYF